ncbi:MAG: DUF3526 domain-containing protein [Pseudomonadota bacterium]
MGSWQRELGFALRERVVRYTLALAVLLASVAVGAGLVATDSERTLLAELKDRVEEEKTLALEAQSDPGSAAYYSFHLTWEPPAASAFTAYGQRRVLPWMHRIRALALEGQLYEADTGNPALASVGVLDFAFVAAYLLPLLLLVMLYDGEASERRQTRYELLLASHEGGGRLFLQRAIVRALLLFVAIALPLLVGLIIAGAGPADWGTMFGALALSIGIWLVLARVVTARTANGATAAVVLLGLWLLSAVAVPAAGRLLADALIPVPEGGEVLLAQREAVNDAWDLPKEATMEPFVASHPEWADYAEIPTSFEWKWYYAFQQVGDETAAPLSQALSEGVAARDRFMSRVAWLSPPLLVERLIAAAAGTDRSAHQRYERCVRGFHERLRKFYYPMLFGVEPYSGERMTALPSFSPC